MNQSFQATKHPVIHGRAQSADVPPDSFLTELVAWFHDAPDDIFATNSEPHDVFNRAVAYLGPWPGVPGSPEWFLARKSAMAEILRVLGAFESSWNWNEGADASAGPEKPEEMEAGIWQISYNSRNFGQDLLDMIVVANIGGPQSFRYETQHEHSFAIEYAARLFRHTWQHNGPLNNLDGPNSVYSQLRRDAMAEFARLIPA